MKNNKKNPQAFIIKAFKSLHLNSILKYDEQKTSII